MFQGLLITKDEAGYRTELREIDEAALPEGNVEVRVSHSTLNYKDALAITGKSPVVRRFPRVPGIDFAGVVTRSDDPRYREGDAVLLNGWGVGETHWGGLAQKARVKADWLVPLPSGFSPAQAMAIGTAGYTAMLCVQALARQGVTPTHGPVVVTGAAGGVGSVAIALLARRGYSVTAVTGRPEEADYLKGLGAQEIIERASLSAPGKPLGRERWAGAVDTVGSHTLANVCASMQYRGVVTACGLAGGMDFPSTVAPFILRGVSLIGVDSVMCPYPERVAAWAALAAEFEPRHFDHLTRTISLADAIPTASAILAGQVRGRVVVDIAA